ncbi:MAG: hypothetical protein CMI68_02260 [Candidatus Pelagibacter sp.]|nr:hypothetical protein [Candidatus Pelagibacter sp.]
MKNLLTFSILTYLLLTINSSAITKNSQKNVVENEKILKIGVLLPLSGKFKDVGESFLKAIQLALFDIGNKNIKIYPKNSGANSLDSYLSAMEFKELGIKIVIGPIFHESLEKLGEVDDITFISLTNKTNKIPKNIIAFGINADSQIDTLKKYFKKKEISKTLLLSPKFHFSNQVKIIEDSKLKFYKIFLYSDNSNKITSDIEKITNYQERKKNLERRIEILKHSDLYKDKIELEELEQKHTLGKVSFDSVIVVDFGERLKSVLTSFLFSDISSEDVNFFTLNQWFDETLFNENASQNLYFPAIDFDNLKKFKKKYLDTYEEKPNIVSILAYDALGLIYYCWFNNNDRFETNQLYNKNGFKGLHGKFVIKNNLSKHQLGIYKVHKKKFLRVY